MHRACYLALLQVLRFVAVQMLRVLETTAYNEFLFSLMFLDNPNSFTLSRAIQYLSGDAETPRQYLMAGSVIVTLPVLFIFVYFEKYLVSGLTAGSVKG